MSVAVIFVIVCSNVVVSMIRRFIPGSSFSSVFMIDALYFVPYIKSYYRFVRVFCFYIITFLFFNPAFAFLFLAGVRGLHQSVPAFPELLDAA